MQHFRSHKIYNANYILPFLRLKALKYRLLTK